MTDFVKNILASSGDRLLPQKADAPKKTITTNNNLLKNGFKLNLISKNGYKTILSKSNEDISPQSLLTTEECLKNDKKFQAEEIRTELTANDEEEEESPLNTQKDDNKWFNTWPSSERYEKVKSNETIPIINSNIINTRNNEQQSSINNNKLTLNEALKNISLAYSPVTKKLHLVDELNSFEFNNYEQIDEDESLSVKNHDNNTTNDINQIKGNSSPRKTLGHKRIQNGSFSSTISTVSEPSTSGSLIGSDDRDEEILFEESNNKTQRKKSFTNFLTKNVFSWKSNNNILGNNNSESTISVWKLFSTKNHYCCEINNSSSPQHNNNVASSSALIQLKRPSSLPAKTHEEELKHAQEYNEILQTVKRKEAKTCAAKEKFKKLQLQQEEQLANAAKHFQQNVIPNWSLMEKHKKTQELWWQGLPSNVRGRIWQLAIGNELNITRQLYEICLNRAQNRLNNSRESNNSSECENDQESSMDVIELDISRTFPNLGIFQQGGPYSEALHSLLASYVCFRPDIGYVQGMSYIAAILILNMEPDQAFICFGNLLNQPLHLNAFTLNQLQMNAYYDAYNKIFNNQLPKLYGHFADAGLTPDLYLLDWIYTIYAKSMPLDVACRIWDVYLRDGYEFIFRTALGILHLYQTVLSRMDFLDGAQFLTKLPDDISSDLLFKSIRAVQTNIGKISFNQIVEQCFNNINNNMQQ